MNRGVGLLGSVSRSKNILLDGLAAAFQKRRQSAANSSTGRLLPPPHHPPSLMLSPPSATSKFVLNECTAASKNLCGTANGSLLKVKNCYDDENDYTATPVPPRNVNELLPSDASSFAADGEKSEINDGPKQSEFNHKLK